MNNLDLIEILDNKIQATKNEIKEIKHKRYKKRIHKNFKEFQDFLIETEKETTLKVGKIEAFRELKNYVEKRI